MTEQQTTAGIFDVAVIGYGPTGLALALWLGQAGHRVAVVERWPELYTLPRAGHVDGEVMRLFQRMGIAEELAQDSSVTRGTVIRDSDDQVLATVPEEQSDQGWHAHYSLYQPNLELAMDARVRHTGTVTVLQGWQAEQISRQADGTLSIALAHGAAQQGNWIPDGEHTTVATRWLVGADGANSLVADFIGTTTEDLGYQARALVIFAERMDPAVGADMPDSEVGMNPRRPYVAFRESGKRLARWEFMVHDDETNQEVSAPATAWRLIAPWGFTPENSRLVRQSVYEFRTLIATTWRKGNVLLAGDAAHRMPPFQGQGMCSGQRDALALAWRLDLVLRDVADPALLDSYPQERRPHVAHLTRNAAERGRQFWLVDPDDARRRDSRLRAGLAGDNFNKGYGTVPVLDGGLVLKDAAGQSISPAGQLSPQFEVASGGCRRLLDDIVGERWLLLARDSAELPSLDPHAQAVFEQLGAYTWAVDEQSSDHPRDVDGRYAAWLENLGMRFLLIRPDCYIFGGAHDIAETHRLAVALGNQLHLKVKVA